MFRNSMPADRVLSHPNQFNSHNLLLTAFVKLFLFQSNAPRFPKGHWFFKSSLPSPACPSGKSNVQMNMVECYEQGKTEVPGQKPVPFSTFYTTIHRNQPAMEPEPPWWQLLTNSLNHGTTFKD